MSLFDSIKKLFASTERLDVSKRFQLDKQASTGTMSKFRLAKEITTGKTFGIKFLDEEKRQHFESRFKGLNKPSEGEIGTLVSHPRVVKTIEFGITTTDQHYILVDFIDGPGLDRLLKSKDEPFIKSRLKFIVQIAQALEAVHDAGLIHRDVCPRNFIADRAIENVTLIDFGLSVPNEPNFCLPGNRTGTPQFMSPEIVRRRPTSHRVDIFSFGVTVFMMLTFTHPWETTDTTGVGALVHDKKPPLDILSLRPNLNPRLAGIVMQCLKKDPSDRPGSMGEILKQIRTLRREEKS